MQMALGGALSLVSGLVFRQRPPVLAMFWPRRSGLARATRTHVGLLGALMGVGAAGWAIHWSEVGTGTTLRMMLGGPDRTEIRRCKRLSPERFMQNAPHVCPYGGFVEQRADGLHCSKHGLLPPSRLQRAP